MRLRTSLAIALTATVATAQIPCFDQNVGTALVLGDDTFSAVLPLGFTFPYGGMTYTDVQVCSNGYLVLGAGSPGSADYTPTIAELIGNPEARLCPMWADFAPNNGGQVSYNAVPATSTAPAYFAVTFDSVPFWGTSIPATFQVILIDGGGIQIHHDANVQGANTTWVLGASEGNNATSNPVSFAALPITTSGNPTLHENGTAAFVLGESTMLWTPDSVGGFIVTPVTGCAASSSYGTGCYDKPRMVYEGFAANSPTVDLANTSWQIVFLPGPSGGQDLITPASIPFDATTPVANGTNIVLSGYTSSSSGNWDDASLLYTLPTGPFPTGLAYPGGSTPDVIINSNGKIYLGSTTQSTWQFNGSLHANPGGFRDELPCLAPFFNDLDPEPTTGGGAIYVEDPSPTGGIRVTWLGVPSWQDTAAGSPLAVACDIQVDILPGGIMFWSFGANLGTGGSATNDAIIGFSAGNGEQASQPLDWSAIAAHTTGDGSFSPELALSGAPVYGSSVDAVISNLAPSTSTLFGGFISLGFAAAPPGGIHLPSIGVPMPDCYLHLDPNQVVTSILIANTGSGDLSWTWNLPPALPTPFNVYLQGATFSPNAYNSAGVLVTNGVNALMGN